MPPMTNRVRNFLLPLLLVTALTGLAWELVKLPGVSHLGGLAMALLLGLAWTSLWGVSPDWNKGLQFAAKRLLRFGIIMLGVRLNLALIVEAGPKILLVDISVITVGLWGISRLGKKLGLDPVLAALIAVDSSICGGSAVAAAAPVLRARDHDVALVIPLCSLIGTGVMLGYTLMQHAVVLTPEHYGMLVGSTLHEVAQVVAAVTPFPEAVDIGMITKLTRVVFLVPVIGVLGWVYARKHAQQGAAENGVKQTVPKPWFVLGFLLVGTINTMALHWLPEQRESLAVLDGTMLKVSAFLMAMAMAAMGLQTNFARLRENGVRALGTAVLGWMLIASVAATELWLMAR